MSTTLGKTWMSAPETFDEDSLSRLGKIYNAAREDGYDPFYAAMLCQMSYNETGAVSNAHEKGKGKTGTGAFSATGIGRSTFVNSFNKYVDEYNKTHSDKKQKTSVDKLDQMSLEDLTHAYIQWTKDFANKNVNDAVNNKKKFNNFNDAADAFFLGSCMAGVGLTTPDKFNTTYLKVYQNKMYNPLMQDVGRFANYYRSQGKNYNVYEYMRQRHFSEKGNNFLVNKLESKYQTSELNKIEKQKPKTKLTIKKNDNDSTLISDSIKSAYKKTKKFIKKYFKEGGSIPADSDFEETNADISNPYKEWDVEIDGLKAKKYLLQDGRIVYKFKGMILKKKSKLLPKSNRNGGTLYYKKGGKSKIHIKKLNEGKFTDYCGGKVTDACIAKAKASGNKKLIKRATFAANARKWNH